MHFSSRVRGEFEPNDFSQAVGRLRSSGARVWDLTVSNPTLAGFDYPLEEIRDALARAAQHPYRPDPRGLPDARRAVAEYYRCRGKDLSPEDILLTSGTSEGYGYLFKLLCDPGDAVLFPQPSYPLVELLAGLEGAQAVPYPLTAEGWRWDTKLLSPALTPGVRAVVAVSPNNPTGSMLRAGELRVLSGFCAARGLALIVDEVFLDYPAPGKEPEAVSSAGNPDALTFTLGGLSKACGLPHLKLAWIAVGGPERDRRNALSRLEFIADAFLSVGTPVQQAASDLLALGGRIRDRIRRRIDRNEETLRKALGDGAGATLFPRDGGWYAVIGLPGGVEDEGFALELLHGPGVIVQPGYFFDMENISGVVISLLAAEDVFAEGVARMSAFLREMTMK